MKKQKIYVTALLLSVFFLAGCSKDSKLQVVVRKETPEGATTSEESSESIREQVQAPETLNTTLEFPEMTVEVNARVVVPDVTGIRQKKVESRIFEDRDFKLIEEELFQGGGIYDGINETAEFPEKEAGMATDAQMAEMSEEMETEALPELRKPEKDMETSELIQKAGDVIERIFSKEEPVSIEEINGWKNLLQAEKLRKPEKDMETSELIQKAGDVIERIFSKEEPVSIEEINGWKNLLQAEKEKEEIKNLKERRKIELLWMLADEAAYFLETPSKKVSLKNVRENEGALVFRDQRAYNVERKIELLWMLADEAAYFLETPSKKVSLKNVRENEGALVFRDQRAYNVDMNNEYSEYVSPIVEITDPFVDSFYHVADTIIPEGKKIESISTKEAIKEGVKLLNQLGMKDMTLEQAEKAYLYFYQDQNYENWRIEEGVRLEFIKNVEGIPVNYGENELILNIDQTGLINWPCEKIKMVISKSGLSGFSWECPGIVEEWQEENPFLLPFSEIEKIFREMIVSHFWEQMVYYGEGFSGMGLKIEEVRLGYTQVASTSVTGNETNENRGEDGRLTFSGILVPAWSFIGRVVSTEDPGYQSERFAFMVINAMDGSIIKK